MNIAFVAYPFAELLPPYHGSMGASIYTIASSLADSCNVVVYGLRNAQKGAKPGIYNGAEYRFIPSASSDGLALRFRAAISRLVRFPRPLSTSAALFPSFGRQVAADLAKQKWDVIHVQHCTQYIPEIRRLNPGAKIVLHIHAEWFSQSNFDVIARRIRGVDLLLTVSDYVTRKTQRTFPELADRCETMYNGIDTREFDREKDYEAARRRREKRILYVGGIWPHKGPHILIDAFKLVAEKYPDVRLDLVGPQGDYPIEETSDVKDRATLARVAPYFKKDRLSFLKSKLLRRPSEANAYLQFLKAKLPPALAEKVAFHGFVSRQELVDFYYKADVFVFPPVWNEAFGCTPVEAMAAGIPAVVSRCGGIVETVEDRRTGFLVETNDSQALARAMLKLLEDDALREKMGRAARDRALQHFTWDAIAEAMRVRYQALYEVGSQAREVTPEMETAVRNK